MVANEIQFLSWLEFNQMAPSILRLEVRRLETLIRAGGHDVAVHNALVKARFEINRFITCLAHADRASLEAACAPHLHAALLALAFDPHALDAAARPTLAYVIDRLTYVLDRIGLIY